jgi:hypothetical protein
VVCAFVRFTEVVCSSRIWWKGVAQIALLCVDR